MPFSFRRAACRRDYRIAVAVLLVVVCGACGSHAPASNDRLALRFLRLVSSPHWRDANRLEAAGTAATAGVSIERGLHQTITTLHARLARPPTNVGDTVRLLLRGRQRLKINGVFVGTEYGTVHVVLTVAGGKIDRVGFTQSSRIAPPAAVTTTTA